MSAASEEILLQILQLESLLTESKTSGKNTSVIEQQLTELREKFLTMNENLKNNGSVLKG